MNDPTERPYLTAAMIRRRGERLVNLDALRDATKAIAALRECTGLPVGIDARCDETLAWLRATLAEVRGDDA